MLPDTGGKPQGVLVGLGKEPLDAQAIFWLGAALADRLPAGDYRLATPLPSDELFLLGWTQGGYRYLRYKSRHNLPPRPHLEPPAPLDLRYVQAATRACSLAPRLINTPANDMGPAELAAAALAVAPESGGKTGGLRRRGADGTVVVLRSGAAVRAHPPSDRPAFPRPGAPRITLGAKASASIPAASTSRPRPACC